MKLIIEESDFDNLVELEELAKTSARSSKESGVVSNVGTGSRSGLKKSIELQRKVVQSLPNVISRTIGDTFGVIGDFELESFELNMTLGGNPFGVGLEASLSLNYSKKESISD